VAPTLDKAVQFRIRGTCAGARVQNAHRRGATDAIGTGGGKSSFTLVEERIGQLHFCEELLGRVFIDIQLVT